MDQCYDRRNFKKHFKDTDQENVVNVLKVDPT